MRLVVLPYREREMKFGPQTGEKEKDQFPGTKEQNRIGMWGRH